MFDDERVWAGTEEEAVWCGHAPSPPYDPWPPAPPKEKVVRPDPLPIEPLYEVHPSNVPPLLDTVPITFSPQIKGVTIIPDTPYVLIKTDTHGLVWYPQHHRFVYVWPCTDEWSMARDAFRYFQHPYLFVIMFHDRTTFLKKYHWQTGACVGGPWVRWADRIQPGDSPEVLRVKRSQPISSGDREAYVDTVTMCTTTGRILQKPRRPYPIHGSTLSSHLPNVVKPGWTLKHKQWGRTTHLHGPTQSYMYHTGDQVDYSSLAGWASRWVLRVMPLKDRVLLYEMTSPEQPWTLLGQYPIDQTNRHLIKLLNVVITVPPPFRLESLPQDVWTLVWQYVESRLLLWINGQLMWVVV